ncbi:MAG: 50S ribosomal protein L6, partial [Desulfobulbaceae bacterium]|nr:50S ribosomal protein L6 [Desulfobulbaceae bacterium]
MSRVGQKPIDVPSGVDVKVASRKVTVKGPLGELMLDVSDRLDTEVAGGKVTVRRKSDSAGDKSLHGLTRTLIQNMISGVVKGFSKELEIQGVGF